jgi:glycosyltransferase involved in cell wall biosynthesis
MRIDLVSEHASPLAVVGGVDAGGQNVHVAALASGLARRGHEVRVFTRRDSTDLPTQVETPEGYLVEHVPAGPPVEVPKDELLPAMAAFGDYLRTAWKVDPADVVHSHFWMSGLAAVRGACGTGIPIVHTFHALGSVKRRHQGDRDTSPAERIELEASLCQQVDHVIATCRDEIDELAAMGAEPSGIDVIPCGVDTSEFTPSGPVAPPRGALRRLVVIGRLVERKGVGNTIEALASLPGVELLVAGGPSLDVLQLDPEACRLLEIARTHGVEDRVHLLGSVPRAAIPGLLRSADIVVAVPWYEPFGIVPVEAMACGRPVVGSAVGGLLDTVLPGVCGELVPPRRPDLVAAAIQSLLDDDSRREAYSKASVRRARERYGWPQVCADTERVYEQVLHQTASGRSRAEVA